MRVTQSDIAKLAKVSQATVSRVLAGDDRVEDSARDRVLSVVKKHNYQPDVRARSLRTARTGLIGLVLKRPHGGLVDDHFFAALSAGIMDYLIGKPYHLCVDMVTDDMAQESVYDDMLRTRRVDGLILVEAENADPRLALLQRDQFPFVLIGNPNNDSITSVDNDNYNAGRIATKHLIDAGFKRIGFLGREKGLIVSDERIQGFRDVMQEHGLHPRSWHCGFGFDAAARKTRQVFTEGDPPGAMIVLDDFMSFGFITAARAMGHRVPEDIGIVSFNDSNLCNLIEGGLTSISLNMSLLVENAVDMLLDLIQSSVDRETSTGRRAIIPCELMVRRSSARMRGDS